MGPKARNPVVWTFFWLLFGVCNALIWWREGSSFAAFGCGICLVCFFVDLQRMLDSHLEGLKERIKGKKKLDKQMDKESLN